MADSSQESLKEIARHLKDIAQNQRDQTRILKALNHNFVEIFRKPSDIVEPVPTEEKSQDPATEPPRGNLYGWTIAALHQREGTLKPRDMKRESDESLWMWTGEAWERIEEPPRAAG